jgi:ubiquinone biosynthesis monooxygenase Coq7
LRHQSNTFAALLATTTAQSKTMQSAPTFDLWINALDQGLRALFARLPNQQDNPALRKNEYAKNSLSSQEQAAAGALMRVNHVGEVCAQALYSAQALTSPTPLLSQHFEHARAKETDHLAWTRQRLDELGARPSLLNPLWYAGAFALGLAAGRMGDKISLGFVMETERQVEAHLQSHLDLLPPADHASRAIVAQMAQDEAAHGAAAAQLGGTELPQPVKLLMKAAAKVMTTVAYRI